MSKKRMEDKVLWDRVKKTTKPLHANFAQMASQFEDLMGEKPVVTKSSNKQLQPNPRILRPHRPEPAISVNFAPAPHVLDEKTTRKISKGRIQIDAKIDLHGMTQIQAHSRLFRFLEMAHAMNKRTVLVITGKGVRGEGILKSMVPRWLTEPEFRFFASGYHEANIAHGGSGALYVRIRKNRETV